MLENNHMYFIVGGEGGGLLLSSVIVNILCFISNSLHDLSLIEFHAGLFISFCGSIFPLQVLSLIPGVPPPDAEPFDVNRG